MFCSLGLQFKYTYITYLNLRIYLIYDYSVSCAHYLMSLSLHISEKRTVVTYKVTVSSSVLFYIVLIIYFLDLKKFNTLCNLIIFIFLIPT